MKALVTGGAGFIGSNIVKELLKRKYSVTVLDNLTSGYQSNLDQFESPIKFINGDIRNDSSLNEATDNIDTIFHLAASVGNKRSIDRPIEDAEINVMGTVRLLEMARKKGIKKIVYSSSAGVFGELKTLPIKENHPIDPDSPYGATKLCAEKECIAYSKLHGMNIVCLRYFNVYGPNQRFDAYGNVIPIFVFNALSGKPITIFGDGEQTRDFINVKDVVQANLKAAENIKISGIFNMGSGTSITINNLVKKINQKINFTKETKYLPPRPGDVRDSLADISLAKTKLKYKPEVGMNEGLAEYIDWARIEASRIV